MSFMAKPYFERSRFDGWTREEIIEAYVGLYRDRERRLASIQRLEAQLEAKQEPYR